MQRQPDAVAALIFTNASCREEKTLAEFTDGKKPKRQKRQRQDDPEARRRRRNGRKGFSVAIMLIALVLSILVMFVGFITDWMWFRDLGYTSVFWKRLLTQLELGVPVFVVVTLLARFYLGALRSGYFKKIESHEIPNMKRINSTSWILSIVFGLGIGFYTSSGTWLTLNVVVAVIGEKSLAGEKGGDEEDGSHCKSNKEGLPMAFFMKVQIFAVHGISSFQS